MPAKSAAQQKAAGAALSAKRGDTPKKDLKGASKSMLSMSETELEKDGLDQAQGQTRAREALAPRGRSSDFQLIT
jgi:hypothetical protein